MKSLRRVKPVSGTESFVATRIRRDCKKAMRGQPSSKKCGTTDCLFVPLAGNAIRYDGKWYTICCICGSIMHFTTLNKFGSDVCCLLCDAQSINVQIDKPTSSLESSPKCRFCGKRQTKLSNWTRILAPLDESSDNAGVPPPLRAVFYCNKHYRSWAIDAHRTQKTAVVLSHIGMNVSLHALPFRPRPRTVYPRMRSSPLQARPQFGAEAPGSAARSTLERPKKQAASARNANSNAAMRLRRLRKQGELNARVKQTAVSTARRVGNCE